MLHPLVHFRLFQTLLALLLLLAKALHHVIQRVFAGMRLQPALARGLHLALQPLDQPLLLDDGLVDAFDELLTVEQRTDRHATVAKAVIAPVPPELLQLLLSTGKLLLLLGHALQGVFLAALRLIHRWL